MPTKQQSEVVKRALAMLQREPKPIPVRPAKSPQNGAVEVQESETIQAVKIASHILQDEIWIILDRSFIPGDGLACYYAEEIPLLKDKTPEDLRSIHKAKLAFPGCRVIQEGPDK